MSITIWKYKNFSSVYIIRNFKWYVIDYISLLPNISI